MKNALLTSKIRKPNAKKNAKLKARDCKYQGFIFKTEKTDFFLFCQEKPFGELFSKMRLKLAREFLILRNPTNSRNAVFALQPQKI